MSCDTCVKINPLPECIDSDNYNPYTMTGLIFDDVDTIMIGKFRNESTGATQYIQFETDSSGEVDIDITEIFPLMNHVYTMQFVNKETGNPEQFTIQNADSTSSTGCCIEFSVNIGQTDDNEFFTVSSQECAV